MAHNHQIQRTAPGNAGRRPLIRAFGVGRTTMLEAKRATA
jgi:hypothetical protein